jgi:hypothetical protein
MEGCLRTVPFFIVIGGGEEYSNGESFKSSRFIASSGPACIPWPLAWITDNFRLLVVFFRAGATVETLTVSKTHPSGSSLVIIVFLMPLVKEDGAWSSQLTMFLRTNGGERVCFVHHPIPAFSQSIPARLPLSLRIE